MYTHPRKVKDNRMTMRLNDDQRSNLHELADIVGDHPTALLRELGMERVDELLAAARQLNEEKRKSIHPSSGCGVSKLRQIATSVMESSMTAITA